MKCFSNIRAKRSTAFVVLLVWLFTLALGVANACSSQSLESFGQGSPVTQAFAMVTASRMSGDHGESFASFEAHFDTSDASCLEVFNDSGQAQSGTDILLKSLAFDPMENEEAAGDMKGMSGMGTSSSRLAVGAEFNILKLIVIAGARISAKPSATLSQPQRD